MWEGGLRFYEAMKYVFAPGNIIANTSLPETRFAVENKYQMIIRHAIALKSKKVRLKTN